MARSIRHLGHGAARAIAALATAILVPTAACSSKDDAFQPIGAAGAGGSGNTAGSGTSGAGMTSAGAGAGGASGGTAGASGGTTGGSAGSGMAGSMANGGTGGATAGTGGDAGGGPAGSGGAMTAGASGAAGSGTAGTGGGAGATGTAMFTVDVELASDVDADAPGTIGIVTWTADIAAITDARIEFGLDTTYGMNAPVDLTLTDHRTLLLGMKPERTYHFRVIASDATQSYASDDYTVDTGPATDLVPLGSFEPLDEAGRERGFIIASYWQGMGSSVPFIMDADGDIVWWYSGGPNGIARAVMSADGKNMWMIAASNMGAALRRVSMDTLDAQTYQNTVGSHDITPVSGETMAFLEYGESDCDSIYEIVPSGETEEIFESQGVVSSGGCHSNALRYSQKEDVYTFSDVNQDVFVVNRAGEVQWRLTERVSGGRNDWGGTQHGHHLLDNSIVIFANRATMNASAAIEYDLQGMELLRFSSGDFSQNLGDVQRLPGGNTLITFSNDGIIKEIDENDEVVLEIDSGGSSFGYSLWRPTLYGPPPDISM